MSDRGNQPASGVATGIAIGMCLGVAFGVALDNIGLGIGLGMAIGAAIGGLGGLQFNADGSPSSKPPTGEESSVNRDPENSSKTSVIVQ
jgi:hypothetical protein